MATTLEHASSTRSDRFCSRIILASTLGTIFEAYDFFLAATLAAFLSKSVFAGVNSTAAFFFTLLSFAAGFVARPFGALLFGHLGDVFGRKGTFLMTIVVMGLATFIIGILPGYPTIGIASPLIFIAMRLLQGLALGGEYGGAATYVAEHAPPDRRGAWTSWMQMGAGLGFLLCALGILFVRWAVGDQVFSDWGWRIPFVASIVLLVFSVWMRLRLEESPAFALMKHKGIRSKMPLHEAFGNRANLRIVLVSLFGMLSGVAMIWFTSLFYAFFFVTQTLKVDGAMANMLFGGALVVSAPLYVAFGKLSDRIGRKPVILAGCLLGAVLLIPLFKATTHYINPSLEAALVRSPVTVYADTAECSTQFNPTGTAKFTSSCDIAKNALSQAGISYKNVTLPAGSTARITVGDAVIESYEGTLPDAKAKGATFHQALHARLHAAGYPSRANPAQINVVMAILLLSILMGLGAMAYAPVAATLVEMFPTRIRYSAMSLPYHIGMGWFGGFLPATAFAIVASNGDIYSGLRYPIIVGISSFFIGLLFMKETRDVDINAQT
ncbi:MFS transporter [Burkholderia sp. USMB20]|uniref:MFS transporter n=1 Tax=Burkholderia sp. USMB20 TaxID=1571773 RepID=UPI0005CF63D0|nr:MFS transporter [Burkholderia sp. USMB20]TGN95696.1 MFS transporter [Burkholderia sp. USMB20]